MEIGRDDFLYNLLGEPTPLKVPSKITIEVDDILVEHVDEILNSLDVNECLFGTCVGVNGKQTFIPWTTQLNDGTKIQFGYYNQKEYCVFVAGSEENSTTTIELPKKYNEYFAHCWKMIQQQSYSYAYQMNKLPKISNPNK